jgi:predicted nucleic acid-binding Zn ribbon protein
LSPTSGGERGPISRSEREEALGAVLSELTTGRPWASGMALGQLGRRWPDVVGERLARESAPAGLVSGVLIVRASSAAWGAQVSFLAREVGEKANATLGKPMVREVRVVVARDAV